jgi:hypothetical protein
MANTNETSLADSIDQPLRAMVRRIRHKESTEGLQAEVLASLILGELTQKLAILHFRLFSVEDLVRDTCLNEEEHAKLARSIRELNSTVRPSLVRSIDTLFIAACRGTVKLHTVAEKVYTQNIPEPDANRLSANRRTDVDP